MALPKTQSAAVYGIGADSIDVEIDRYSAGAPRVPRIAGMPGGAAPGRRVSHTTVQAQRRDRPFTQSTRTGKRRQKPA
jgi:hypothetical protein